MTQELKQDEIEKLIEFVEYTADNIAIVCESIRYKLGSGFITLDQVIILEDIQMHCRMIKKLIQQFSKDLMKIIPYCCSSCEHRASTKPYYCEYYSSKKEIKALEGERCLYYISVF